MSTSWLQLPGTLLKLVVGSPRTDVVSGETTSGTTREATAQPTDLHNDSFGNQKRESSAHESSTATNGHSLHESQVRDRGRDRQPHAALSTSSANGPTSSAQEGFRGPASSQHRKAMSAGSQLSLSSTVSTTGTTTGAYTGFTQNGQYDLTHDVILRGEFISDQQAKAVIVSIRIATYIGITILVVALSYKLTKADVWFTTNIAVQAWNVGLGALCFIALTACCTILASRLYHSHKQRQHWSRRRKITVAMNGAELCVQLVNVCAWIAPNAILLRHNCHWFEPFVAWSAFVSWTCWNTVFLIMLIDAHNCAPWLKGRISSSEGKRLDAIVMDAPIWYHAPKLVLWCILEALALTLSVWITHDQVGSTKRHAIVADPNCAVRAQDCNMQTVAVVLIVIVAAMLILYTLLWYGYMWKAFRDLQKHQYMHYKMGNLIVRMQAHRRLIAVGLFLASFICLVFVKLNSCSSYMEGWLGFAPVYVVETAVVVGGAYLYMPKNPRFQDPVLTVWLQEFGWTEEEKASKMALRGDINGFVQRDLQGEPMFCFGTAVKLFYWSHLVYDIDETGSKRFSIDTALGLYGLTKYEVMWEKAEDTKVLLAWSQNTVLVSFRGTASLANALADIQVWMSHYPSRRTSSNEEEGLDLLAGPKTAFSWLPGGRPAVHRGFLNSWRANRLNDRVKQRIRDIVYSAEVDRSSVKVLCTGHSLGGALASLAAFDIQRHCSCLGPLDVSCYTFGAPRVGNHAFARQYEALVPDTWNIINDQDVIARAGRFWGLYKRAGHRVMINPSGDLIVRPTFIEAAAQHMRPWNSILGGSVPDHLLVNYRKSLVAITLAQFSSAKGFEGGGRGVLQLLEKAEIRDVLATAGLQFEQLKRMGRFGGVVLQLQGLMQKGSSKPVSSGDDAAVICADGVCRLVRASSLLHDSDESGQSGSQSTPATLTRSSGLGLTFIRREPISSSSRPVNATRHDNEDGTDLERGTD